ncbi:alpha/beta fold hydrolase [Corallococcus sp. 4LFB]|uniref:alpha/beta fold hydrolase n=1 Tax=Corallococcus sp. 4LFB TaxID=3383249 RepID=UPI003975D80E
MLFLHGWLDHSHSFDLLCEHLPGSWRTVLLDFRGMGQSGHAGPGAAYHLSDHLLDVEATLDGLALPPVHLVGHSLGGIVALAYAAARPERVLSLTLIESLGPSGGPAAGALQRLRGFLDDSRRPRTASATPRWRPPRSACVRRTPPSPRTRRSSSRATAPAGHPRATSPSPSTPATAAASARATTRPSGWRWRPPSPAPCSCFAAPKGCPPPRSCWRRGWPPCARWPPRPASSKAATTCTWSSPPPSPVRSRPSSPGPPRARLRKRPVHDLKSWGCRLAKGREKPFTLQGNPVPSSAHLAAGVCAKSLNSGGREATAPGGTGLD